MMIDVVAALIWDEDRFLICQRTNHNARPLLWEFPGGKVNLGESMEDALMRELKEELDVTISVGGLFYDVIHEYSEITIHLTVWNAVIIEGTPQLLEHKALQWIILEEIPHYTFCPADDAITKRMLQRN